MRTTPPFVLVLGTSPTSRKIIAASLRRRGCEVISYEKPESALEALARGSIRFPDVVFVDLALKEMKSYAVIRKLQTYRCRKIIGVDTRDHKAARVRTWLMGVEYLPLPLKEKHIA